jgi:hypothetical protein
VQIKQFLVVASVVLAAGWMSAGCEESDARRASKKLNDATQTAVKLTARSQALVANPHYLVDGQAGPYDKPLVSAADIKAFRDLRSANRPQAERDLAMAKIADQIQARVKSTSPEQVHPEALTSLERAQKLLQDAIAEVGDVKGAEGAKAVALSTLASIQSDMGHLHRRSFENARAQAAVLAAVVELNARQAEWEGTLIVALDGLVDAKFNPSVVSYEKALANVKTLLAEVESEVRTLSGQVRSLEAERSAAQASFSSASQEATEKLLSSQAMLIDDAEQSDVLFEESVALNQQALATSQTMSELDLALAVLQDKLTIAEAKLAVLTSGGKAAASAVAPARADDDDDDAPSPVPAAKTGGSASAGIVGDAEALVKNFTALQQRLAVLRREAQTRRSESETQCVDGLKAIGGHYKTAMDLADERALKAFDQSVTSAKASYALVKDPAVKAMEGAALREYASIRQQQRDMLTSVLRAISMVPRAGSGDIIGDVNSTVTLKDWGASAMDRLGNSAEAFGVAANELSRNQRGHQAWVYQANAAISRMQQAAATDDPRLRADAENEARVAVANALTGRENSPHLRYVRQLNAHLLKQRTPMMDRPSLPAFTPAVEEDIDLVGFGAFDGADDE